MVQFNDLGTHPAVRDGAKSQRGKFTVLLQGPVAPVHSVVSYTTRQAGGQRGVVESSEMSVFDSTVGLAAISGAETCSALWT